MNARQRAKARQRKHDQALQQRSQSAQASGISNKPAQTGVTQSCPKARLTTGGGTAGGTGEGRSAAVPTNYEFCNLQSLQLVKKVGDGQRAITLTRQRRAEPVSATAELYASELASHDLVLETLSVARITERKGKGVEAYKEDVEPQQITATARLGPAHASFQPLHPHTSLSGDHAAETHGGAPLAAALELPAMSVASPRSWGRVFPFWGSPNTYTVAAVSCGNVSGGTPLRNLSMHLVAFPEEEWKITIGIAAGLAMGYERERDWMDDNGGRGPATKVTTTVERGFQETSVEVATFDDGDQVRTRATKGAVVTTFHEVKHQRKKGRGHWRKPDKDKKTEARRIEVEWKVAGEEVECDAAETINKLIEVGEIVDDLSKLLDGVKVGWSVSAKFEFLVGNLVFDWGRRWPASYTEQDRVYYVENFLAVGGECTLFKGEVEGSAGVKVEPWWLPGTKIVFELALKLELALTLGGQAMHVWSNKVQPRGKQMKQAQLAKLDGGASFEPELKLEGGAKILGVGAIASAVIDGKQELTADGEITLKDGPSAKTTFKSEPVSAYFKTEVSWLTVSTWESEHYEIIAGGQGWKDRPLF